VRVRMRNAHPARWGVQFGRRRDHAPPAGVSSRVLRQVIDARARSWSRRPPRAFEMLEFERIGALLNAVLTATFRWRCARAVRRVRR